MMFKIESLQSKKFNDEYDLIIIGTGPAGYSAGIYAKRFNISVLIIGFELGGMANEAADVENYPGFEKISGTELMEKFKKHAEFLGCDILKDKVVNVEKIFENNLTKFKVSTETGKEFFAKAIIIATGSKKRKLELKNEDKFIGKGVSYCALCDAAFFKDKVVAIVGGGDAALNDTYILSNIAKKIYLLVRGDSFKAAPFWTERLKELKNVEVFFNTEVKELIGNEKLEKIKIYNNKDKSERELEIDGLFIGIGIIPLVELAKQLGVELDDKSKIKVDYEMKTNVPGVFAAGDCTNACPHMQQIITSAAQGATAAESAYKFIKMKKTSSELF
ncbi:MAG: thioredoxin-disulfide reductase [Candidatus Woesearchaeota archaeon]